MIRVHSDPHREYPLQTVKGTGVDPLILKNCLYHGVSKRPKLYNMERRTMVSSGLENRQVGEEPATEFDSLTLRMEEWPSS